MAAEPPSAATPETPTAPTDPYVIYQLRKPSQRGTAVIPRFVPNTHAPAFSPANYRFARVWATTDPAGASPSALLNAPRSFEYAGSLGSESSFWSDTSSWVSVSSLRTAQSDVRAPLLHAAAQPVSAASFFNSDFENTRLRSAVRTSTRSSDLDSTVRPDFRYPPALSESVSEDAVVDDLLSLRNPQYPAVASDHDHHSTSSRPKVSGGTQGARPSAAASTAQNGSRNPSANSGNNNSSTPSRPYPSSAQTDNAAASTTVPSVHAAPQRSTTRAAQGRTGAASGTRARISSGQNPALGQRDRVPGSDKDFLQRAHRAPDATTPQRRRSSNNRRSPSFEIRRGRPDHSGGNTRRSVSWSLVPKAFLNRDPKKKKKGTAPAGQPATVENTSSNTRKKKLKGKQKDRPRGIAPEDVPGPEDGEGSRGHRIAFQKTLSRKDVVSSHRRHAEAQSRNTRTSNNNPVLRRERPQDRPREDRRRADRPRQHGKGQLKDSSAAPVQTSVVASFREKAGGSTSSHSQRMRSGESSDQVASRISSDLSSTTNERTAGSGSEHSTPVLSRSKYQADSHELDPAANGVSSDVSSHVSGVHGKASPLTQQTDPSTAPSGVSSSIDFDAIQARRISRGSPFRSELFAFPSSSSESGAFADPNQKSEWESPPGAYPEYANTPVRGGSDATDESLDPVARALEKNRARSAGGPLLYLMKQTDVEMDVNTQSTGLTSLADESVSTHKTISAVGDDYRMMPQVLGLNRFPYRDSKKLPTSLHEGHDTEMSGSPGIGRPIFQNSALFNYSGRISPSRVSSASPRRFHSDWSDPHATDIEVYCQCNCSCVYEEECGRSCELVYGRSPSVSSTRSCSRRGYAGFQTLPPTIDTAGTRHRRPSSDLIENSDEPLAFMGRLNPGGGAGTEGRGNAHNTQKSYIRASALDELPDPSTGEDNERMVSGTFMSGPGDVTMSETGATYDRRPLLAAQLDVRRQHGGTQRREEQYEEHRRHEPMDTRTARSHASSSSASHTRDSGHNTRASERPRHSRRSESSPRRRSNGQSEGNTSSRGDRTRSSSRRTVGTSSSSRQSSGLSRRHETPRSEMRSGPTEGDALERRRRESEARRRYGSRSPTEGPQQMGTSYVVKRNGLPPFGQSNIPQPYRASGYGRDVSYEYDDEAEARGEQPFGTGDTSGRYSDASYANVEYGPTPVVELEFETGSIGSHDMYRHNNPRSTASGNAGRVRQASAKQESQHRQARRADGGHHGQRKAASGNQRSSHAKADIRANSKQLKPTSRTNSKGSSRSRTPLFGIF